jgi:hypothetical protein
MEKHIWIYRDRGDEWKPFNDVDQEELNIAISSSTEEAVRVLGGRFDAHVAKRYMTTVYESDPKEIRFQRARWFVEGHPFLESEDQLITDWFVSSQVGTLTVSDRQLYKSSDGAVMMASQTLLSADKHVSQVSGSGFIVPDAGFDDPNIPCSHLVMAIHGIGESLWSKKAFNLKPFEINCGLLRENLAEYDQHTRTEILHVNWYHILSESEYTKRIADITLPSIPVFRQLANEAVADAIFYLNQAHREKIVSFVAERILNIVTTFKQRNPSWNNRLSLLGHSLGSVIAYDVLSLKKVPPEIQVTNLFLLGSPLGMFLTARGDTQVLPIPQCMRIYNIIQPNDPVAYRIEPFIAPATKSCEPVLIPYHRTGGLATTTQVKHAASTILGLFTSEGDLSYIQKVAQVVRGSPSPSTESPVGLGLAQIESMNSGERVDWVVQQGFMPGATEYADALVAHVAYFDNLDIAKFVHDKIVT